jgi:branched-chain amino acid transport system substrate-binding protein
MKISNSTDREAIAAAMPKVNFKGLVGQVAFDEKGDIKNGVNSIYEMKDGKLNFVQAL